MTEDNGGSEGKGPKLTEKEVPATHSEKEWLKIRLQWQVRIGLRRTKHLAFFSRQWGTNNIYKQGCEKAASLKVKCTHPWG